VAYHGPIGQLIPPLSWLLDAPTSPYIALLNSTPSYMSSSSILSFFPALLFFLLISSSLVFSSPPFWHQSSSISQGTFIISSDNGSTNDTCPGWTDPKEGGGRMIDVRALSSFHFLNVLFNICAVGSQWRIRRTSECHHLGEVRPRHLDKRRPPTLCKVRSQLLSIRIIFLSFPFLQLAGLR